MITNRNADCLVRARLTVCGAVQGVGFRPCVHRLAARLGLAGWVRNTAQGVGIELEGGRSRVEAFLLEIEAEKPPRSFIQSIETEWLRPLGAVGFEIQASDFFGKKTAPVLPDLATCGECLRDIFDPGNRRCGYPFTNCTQCGPRFSVIESLPYDRANTSMRGFALCADCQREYEDPRDRRFHAQPNACPVCGPQLDWRDSAGGILASKEAALVSAASAIEAGGVVAVKGLGGFHLMVDARNDEAVLRLRSVKHRKQKPFAVMAPSLESARMECEISGLEERLLLSAEAPIVLLRRLAERSCVTRSVAPGNPLLGVMLPYTPLHHLLLRRLGFTLVATSGNRSDEPICTDEGEAVERLSGIADYFLTHNRPIVRPIDDSVVRVMLGRELVLRRARGYAPLPVSLKPREPTLCVGAHLKNTIALTVGDSVILSQHIGDLETTPAFAAFEVALRDLSNLYESMPTVIVADAHPDYLPTKVAVERAAQSGARLVFVQHHYAHILACMAENRLVPPVLGIAWDGSGYGPDGTIWGGEFLEIKPGGFTRFAHLRTFSLPGGEAAVKEPRRSALGLLYEIFGDAVFEMTDLAPVRAFTATELRLLRTMLSRKINSPRTSSMGRLFDAVASIAGIRQVSEFEGQAAMELEWQAGADPAEVDAAPPPRSSQHAVPASILSGAPSVGDGAPWVVDWEPMIRRILARCEGETDATGLSREFHQALAAIILQVSTKCGCLSVALSGGCFQNERLLVQSVVQLKAHGFDAFWHRQFPPNDGGIALGQAAACITSEQGNGMDAGTACWKDCGGGAAATHGKLSI